MAMRFTLDGESFDLTPELVRARLAGHVPEAVHQYWVEIDGTRWPVKQAISVATGVYDRRRFQSQASRRWLEKLGFTIGGNGRGVQPLPTAPRATQARMRHARPNPVKPGRAADVVLIGCVKTKLSHGARAKDLYTSDYFRKMRTYAEASGRPWFILSAEHGLIAPDEWLEPYERYLPDTSHVYRMAWGEKVAVQLAKAVGPLMNLVVEVHAGAAYVESVEGALVPRGARVIDQLCGLSFGQRLSWYLQHQAATGASGPSVVAQSVVAQLKNLGAARSLTEVMASGGTGLRVPGMYSWWVDETGADELSTGVNEHVRPGLIYAGLAGATRSGGRASSNTLWGRIATMHLGKKHEFSTLRRSLGSVLAEAHGQPTIDEEWLTRWMHDHLRVITIPVEDVDSLDRLESEILAELDPPLNLAKVPKTQLRMTLSALRKKHAGGRARHGA